MKAEAQRKRPKEHYPLKKVSKGDFPLDKG